KLQKNQSVYGGWSWFEGGQPNRFITQYIVSGFGHLKHLGVKWNGDDASADRTIDRAIQYLDNQFVQEYKDIQKYNKKADLNADHLSYSQLHYLYMRSFYPEHTKSDEVKTIIKYYQNQIQKYWISRSLYGKGMMALI